MDKKENKLVESGNGSTSTLVTLTRKEIEDRPNDQELGAYVRAILNDIDKNSGKQLLLG